MSRRQRLTDRYPLIVSALAAAGLYGLFQSAFLVWRNRDFGGLEMAVGVTRVGLMAGSVTVLVLVPVVLLARRWHPAWRRGERLPATWAVTFAPAAALVAWLLADEWVSGPVVPEALQPWIAAAAALAAAFASSWVRPPRRFLGAAALVAPVALVLSFLLPAPAGPGGGAAPPDSEPAADVPPAGGPPKGVPPTGRQLPDVVLVSIDTLRADRLGVYGRSPSITPEMDRIAAEGVVFARALASAPWTVPSVASMLTGLPAVRHGAGLPLGSGLTFLRSPLDGEMTTLAERFAAAGYRTRAVVANAFLSPQMGMAQGFAEFDMPLSRATGAIFMRDVPLARLLVALFPVERWGDYRAQGVTDKALEWLAADEEGPLFLWIHYIDPHTPFQADPSDLDMSALAAEMRQHQPQVLDDGTVVGEVFAGTSHVRGGTLWLGPEDRHRIEDYYDRAVSYVDEHVGRLFAALRERSVGEGSVVEGSAGRPVIAALTSDHGEEFWDHGHFEHGHDYYREVTRVPLVFWSPGALPAGRTIESLAGLVDVAPTLLELAGVEAPPAAASDEGRSLAALWDGEERGAPQPRFSGGNLYGLPAVLLEDGPWRFILRANGMAELYDTAADPEERFDLSHDHPEIVERYRQVLEPRLAVFLEGDQGEEPQEISPETIEALRSLGYVQ